MSVRAKFVFASYETSMSGNHQGKAVELRSLKFRPVYDNNPDSENGRFFAYTPQGEVTLGTVNPEAWAQFELGKEYFLDFTPAT